MVELQVDAQCAIHALNNALQGEIAPFGLADLREGARLARLADIQAGLVVPAGLQQGPQYGAPGVDTHADDSGNFSYQAVGRALGFRRCDWRGVSLQHDAAGEVDPIETVEAAFRPVALPSGPQSILGIFVHHGSHYTAMVRRNNIIYHIESLGGPSGGGRFVYVVDPPLLINYGTFYSRGRQVAGREVGGLYSIYWDGRDLLAGPLDAGDNDVVIEE